RGGDDLLPAFRSARGVAFGFAGRSPARHGELLDRGRAIVVSDELGEELLERLGPQHRIGPGDLIRIAHGTRAPSRSNACTASIIRHTLTDPATSCTRTIRQPCMTPNATAANDASRRSSIARSR